MQEHQPTSTGLFDVEAHVHLDTSRGRGLMLLHEPTTTGTNAIDNASP